MSAICAKASTSDRLNSRKRATFPTGLAVAGIPTYRERRDPCNCARRDQDPRLGALRRRVGAVLGPPFGKGLALEGEFFAEARMRICLSVSFGVPPPSIGCRGRRAPDPHRTH